MMKFEIGDKVEIVGKSVGRSFKDIDYSEGIITNIYGRGDGSDEDNCIVVAEIEDINGDGDWFAPQDLRKDICVADEIDGLFEDLIDDL